MRKWSIFVMLMMIVWMAIHAHSQTDDFKTGVPFSQLLHIKQRAIIDRLAPPETSERDAPYSTPMYYLLCDGYQDGVGAMSGNGNLVLDRNRPDWQEALMKDWVELGLTSTHFLTYPSQWEKPSTIEAIEDYFRLSKKYGMKIGIRLGGDKSFGGLEASGWDLHPNNPDNRIDEYIKWTKRVATKAKGRVTYYVLGDELNLGGWEAPTGDAGKTENHRVDADKKWTPEIYMRVFPKIAGAIKAIDPEAKISMFGMGGLDWDYIDGLFKLGYAKYADGVAANIGNKSEEEIQDFVQKVTNEAPGFKFYSNGVGYVRAKNTNFYPTNTTGTYDDEEQGIEVAKIMFRGFDTGWASTPYYIVVRQWQLADGTFAPHWYGLMGFTDLLLDPYDNLTFKHYPAWYALQTIAHIFYSRSKTKPAFFEIKLNGSVDFFRVYERNNDECLLVLWNKEGNEKSVSLTLPTQKYRYPVKIDLFNYLKLDDVTYQLVGEKNLFMPDIRVGRAPVIIRLVSEEIKNSSLKPDLDVYKNNSESNTKRVEDLLSRMTLEEKVDMLGGENLNTKENKRLGIPKLLMTDGPLGPTVHKQSTNYSAMINLAASFDTDLMRRVAESIGEETRVMGRNMLLAPMINIIRLPHWGRSFEVFSEDPYLSSRMTVAYVKAVQSKNVIACTKVMTANNQEWNRSSVDVRIDDRSLREIYLPSLEAAVKEADTWSIMTAYNKVNGDYCAESKYLLTDVLKNEWGFTGFVVSDWNGTHSTVKMANAGLDLEMPTARFYGEKLLEAVNDDSVKESTIDDKVRRILGAMFKAGLFDESAGDYGGHSNTPERNTLAREAARKSIVLLKNEKNFLPLNKHSLRSIAVIGPNGNVARMTAGGSGDLEGNYGISPYEGILRQAGKNIQVNFEPGISAKKSNLPIIGTEYFILENGQPGIKAEYFNNMKQEGEPVLTRIEKNIDFDWNPDGQADSDQYGSPQPGLINTNIWSARWTGRLKSPGEGIYDIGFLSNNGMRLYLDGEKILDNWLDALPGQLKMARYHFTADHIYQIRVDFYEETGTSHCKLGFEPYIPEDTTLQKAVTLAGESEIVVLCLGLNKLMEGEANDRTDLGLPAEQLNLLDKITEVNSHTIVVLNNATPILMKDWINKVPAVLEAFYPGQEGGNALAEILFGIVSPSGKLPITFPQRWEDSPAYGTYPGFREEAVYKEGIFVGYRHFDKENIDPLFPFGFGLSYTRFDLKNLELSRDRLSGEDTLTVSVSIKNTGNRDGDEVVQLYIQDIKASVEREVKSLKGFERVNLKPGEEKRLFFKIKKEDLAFYEVTKKIWMAEPGQFKVLIGNSSRDIRLESGFDYVSNE